MRTIYLSLILCALAFRSWAQTTLTLPRWTDYYEWYGSQETGSWVLAFSNSHVYNTRGQETERILIQSDVELHKTRHTYGDFGLLETLELIPGSGGWVEGSKSTYVYDAQGRLISKTQQAKGPDRSSFVNTSRVMYQYTENDLNPSAVLRQDWDEVSNSWLDAERHTHQVWSTDQNNPFKLLSHAIQTAPAPLDVDWVNNERHGNSYDPATRTLTYVLDVPSGDGWVSHSRTLTNFDAQMNPTQIRTYEQANNAWRFTLGTEYTLTYNAESVLTEKIARIRRAEGGELENGYRDVYSDFQTFIVTKAAEQLPASSLAVFPNPTSGDLNITLAAAGFKQAQVQLFNLQGKKLYEAMTSYPSISKGNHVVPCQHLGAGVYVLRILTDNNKEISRTVVKTK